MKSLKLFKSESLVAKRQTNFGEFDERTGLPVAPEFDQFPFVGNVQPISGQELLQMPEGDRNRQILNVFTDFQLKNEDIVARKGADYEVRLSEDWDQSLLNLSHFMARLVRIDVQR